MRKVIKEVEVLNNIKAQIDTANLGPVEKDKTYNVSFACDGKCNLYMSVKNDRLEKRVTGLKQLIRDGYNFPFKAPISGNFLLEVHDPGKHTTNLWTKISNIILEEIEE